MSVNIKLSEKIVAEARKHASVNSRSVPKQIEHWTRIGKISEDNPDLPFSFIKEILLAQEEVLEGNLKPYEFGNKS